MFVIDFSLAVFTSSNDKIIANIVVNELSFNITTNSGESDDRILHLKPGKTEEFDITLTNLNSITVKYGLIYKVCTTIECNDYYDDIPENIEVYISSETPDDLNGIIINGVDFKKRIDLVTTNNSEQDYYLKLDLNAGYEWNDLELSDLDIIKINSFDMDIIAYVDGIQVESFPTTCGYIGTLELYNDGVAVSTTGSSIGCDADDSKWKINLGKIDETVNKIVINFNKVAFVSFNDDSWELISYNVSSGHADLYKVGDIKCIELSTIPANQSTKYCTDGKYPVRIVNNSNYDCPFESETACGFVVEFVEIIYGIDSNICSNGLCKMNTVVSNKLGWPGSELYKYVNGIYDATTDSWNRSNTLYGYLPTDLRNVIADTYVVSSHGSSDSNTSRTDGNWESYDKLYLLSTKEIYGDCGDGTNGTTNCDDTATNVTRQLDWYNADIKSGRTQVTTRNYGSTLINTPIKYYQAAQEYWLRSAYSGNNYGFYFVTSSGSRRSYAVSATEGIAPAFRLG